IFFRANLVGYSMYLFANYLSLILAGLTLNEIWTNEGLYPCAYTYNIPWYSMMLFWGSVINWILMIYGSIGVAAKHTISELKGDYFLSIDEAHEKVKKNWVPMLFGTISILLILAFYIVMASIFGLISKIPYIGGLFFSLTYLIHVFGAIFAIFTIFAMLVSLVYSPIIVSSLDEDSMGTVFNAYMIAWRFPAQIIVYNSILIPLVYVCMSLFAFICLAGLKVVNLLFGSSLLLGQNLDKITSTAFSKALPFEVLKKIYPDNLSSLINSFIVNIETSTISTSDLICSIIIGVFTFFIVLIIISYALSIFSVGQILIFNVFQKRIGVDFLKLNIQHSSFSDDDFNMTNNEETLKGNKDEDLSN
ncbi:MAG: hypothetical protein CMF88_05885, partial [Candidatus Marinimicrobia bacterium]|nr:hypothetical protein [Candidatus Neomarinimicrobiota bacterium]